MDVRRIIPYLECGDFDAVEEFYVGLLGLRSDVERALEIVYPRTDEPWGIRRFFVRGPAGEVVSVLAHVPA